MAIRFAGTKAVLEGHCTVEEAHDLAAWLIAKPGRKVDLARCTGLHGAVLQCLMGLAPLVAAAPADAGLAGWLGRVIALPPASAPAPRAPARRRRRVAK